VKSFDNDLVMLNYLDTQFKQIPLTENNYAIL